MRVSPKAVQIHNQYYKISCLKNSSLNFARLAGNPAARRPGRISLSPCLSLSIYIYVYICIACRLLPSEAMVFNLPLHPRPPPSRCANREDHSLIVSLVKYQISSSMKERQLAIRYTYIRIHIDTYIYILTVCIQDNHNSDNMHMKHSVLNS